MSHEDEYYSSRARVCAFRSKIAKDLHPKGSHVFDVSHPIQTERNFPIPEKLSRLFILDGLTLQHRGISSDAVSQWGIEITFNKIPCVDKDGNPAHFATYETFLDYVDSIVSDIPKVKRADILFLKR